MTGTLTQKQRDYFQRTQHHNIQRNASHVDMVCAHRSPRGLRVLDIGCGGGFFLSRMKELGARVYGIDVSEGAVLHTREAYGIEADILSIENPEWQDNHREAFDVVTLWDVIEHVNYPRDTLLSAAKVLSPGGLIFVGTPCRDAFYHRTGCLTYRMSRGRFPTFLNQMYSSTQFSHKQILSLGDMCRLFDAAGIDKLDAKLLHELSLPYGHYLRKITGSQFLATVLAPLAGAFFAAFRIKNKMIVVGEKRVTSVSGHNSSPNPV